MKNASDWVQVFMTDGSAIGWLVWLLIALVIFQLGKAVWGTFWTAARFLWRHKFIILLRPSWKLLTVLAIVATIAWFNRNYLNDNWQYVEQVYLSPTYLNTDTSLWALSCYESELRRWVSEKEFEIVQRKTRETADAIGSTPLSIYEVAYSECGLNPFAANTNERGDTVAFGWIQFTRAGCQNIQCEGQELTMRTVKNWGRTRNVGAMMDATKSYLVDRAKGNPLPTATDVYVCVFAPGFVGQPESQVLYSASQTPKAYRENASLDGYGVVGDKVVKLPRFVDGKITVGDMRMHLVMKRSKFLGKQQLKPQNQ